MSTVGVLQALPAASQLTDLDAIHSKQQALMLRQRFSLSGGAKLQRLVQHRSHLAKRGAVEQRVIEVQHQTQLALPARREAATREETNLRKLDGHFLW